MDAGDQPQEGIPAQPTEVPANSGAVVVPVQVGDGVEEVVLSYDEAFMGSDTTYIIQFVDDGTNPALASTIASTIASDAATSGATVVQSDIGPVLGVPEQQQQTVQLQQQVQQTVQPQITVQQQQPVQQTVQPQIIVQKPVQRTVQQQITVQQKQQTVQQLTVQESSSSAASPSVPETPTPSSSKAAKAPEPTTAKKSDPQPQAKINLSKALNLQSTEAVNAAKHVEKTPSTPGTKTRATVKDSGNNDSLLSPESDSKRPNRRSVKKPARFADIEISDKKKQKEPKYLKIPSVSKKSLGLQDLCVEVEIDEKLFVSALERSDCDTDGFCKYVFRVSRNPVKTVAESARSEDGPPSPSQQEAEMLEIDIKPEIDIETPEKTVESVEKTVESPATDQSSVKRKRGRPRKSQVETKQDDPKLSKLVVSHEDNKTVKKGRKSSAKKVLNTSADDEDDVTELPADIDDTSDGADCMTALDDIVKSEGVLQPDGTMVESQETEETIDNDPPKSKKKRQALKKKHVETVDNEQPETKKKKVALGKKQTVKKKQTKKKKEPDVDEEDDDEIGAEAAEGVAEEEEKPKRKYVKRNVYQRDDQNYTVKKSETGGKIFVCDICSKECVSAANVLDHLCVHTNVRPVPCEQCGMSFKSQKALKRHVVRHTEKKFICDSCGALFFSASDLKSHSSVHSNRREFVCRFCGKGFNHSTTLSRHKQLHKEQRSVHVCHRCGATFKRKDHVQRHVINIHGGEAIPKSETFDRQKWFRNKRISIKEDGQNGTKKQSRRRVSNKAIPAGSDINNVGSQLQEQVPEAGAYWTIYDTDDKQVHFYKPSDQPQTLYVTEPHTKYTDISKTAPVYTGSTGTPGIAGNGGPGETGSTDQGLQYAIPMAVPMSSAYTSQGDNSSQYYVVQSENNNLGSVTGNWL